MPSPPDPSARFDAFVALSEMQLRTLTDSVPALIWMSGPSKEGVYFNKTWLDFTGRRLDEELGEGWTECMHPGDADAGLAVCAAAFARRAPFETQFRMRRSDGEYRWMHDTGVPRFAPDGTFLGYVGSCVDITEQRLARGALERERELLQKLFDTIPAMIAMYEPSGKVLRLNREFERVTGWSSEAVARVPIMEACYPDPEYRARVQAFMDSCRDGWMDIRMRTRDECEIETSWANIRLSDDTQVGIGIDISDRKRTERALKDADRRKDEFLAMLAHELRNPMAAISSALELMRRSWTGQSEHATRARDIAERQTRQLSRLVDDLLDVARITRGRVALRLEPVNAADALRRAIESAQAAIAAKRHVVTVVRADFVLVMADPARLEQMITNLLANAVKYTDPGGPIELSVEREDGDALIRVRDFGIGIEADVLPRIFEPFVQGSSSLDRSAGGLGIGLTIVSQLAELHSGRITVTSEPRRGSEFVLRIPALALDSTSAREHRDPVETHACSKRVLVVDDNIDMADALAMIMSTWGHETRQAHDGASALQLCAEFQPELVLLDIGLPEMNGYQVARRLRSNTAAEAIRLVAISGYGLERDRAASRAAGFDNHLVKPVDLTALAHEIEQA